MHTYLYVHYIYETYEYEFIQNMDTDTYFGMPDRECWILTM
jgi:hypothetical protein